ncbi:MAG: hypothetical protein J6M93_03960 [Succinivibrio sp.]|nr:hypothetical protein [Succinivibrio sp.]
MGSGNHFIELDELNNEYYDHSLRFKKCGTSGC